jgi:ATP-dependent Lon protease
VILPEANLQDLEEIPRELRRKICFVGVSHMDQVLEAALEETPGPRTSARKLRRATAQTPPKVPRATS